MSKAVKRNVKAKRKSTGKRGGNRAGKKTRLAKQPRKSSRAAGADPMRGKGG